MNPPAAMKLCALSLRWCLSLSLAEGAARPELTRDALRLLELERFASTEARA